MPLAPHLVVHYLAACTAAKVSPASISSHFVSAQDARNLIERVGKLSIPDAAKLLAKLSKAHS